jgi:hypothetical protein
VRRAALPREGQLTDKDMSVLREGDNAFVQHRSTRSAIRDYSMQHAVSMEWDLNPDAIRDKVFKLHVGDRTVILDWEEVLRSGRWI